ncbi:hypothetical protein WCN91_11530 [Pseudoalteromonas sp. YIC-827]|uniref:C2H2-type domain-containing protein n=1 Tax=Pseudoalteromonas qingdaonensis TaxID=3131913 RepID=A0ABU9N170_9GAMM
MKQESCPDCGWIFEEGQSVKAHRKRCSAIAIKEGPSFRSRLPDRLRKVRATITGTYEWALSQPNKGTPSKVKEAFSVLPLKKIETELLALESSLLEDDTQHLKIKRLIALSHAHVKVAAKEASKKNRAQALKELNNLSKPDSPRSNDLLDQYYKSGQRRVTSGGLPSLGKRN